MATLTKAQVPTVEEISHISPDAIALRYTAHAETQTETESVSYSDIVGIVPPARPEGVDALLLFVTSDRSDGTSRDEKPHQDNTSNSNDGGGGGGDSYLGTRLAARLVPQNALPTGLARFSVPALPSYLAAGEGRQFHVIISVQSGGCDADEYFTHVVQPALDYLGCSAGEEAQCPGYRIHRTTSERSILDLAANLFGPQANRGVAQTILLLSGDGGPIDIINGISVVRRTSDYIKPVIGVLALGTGNALANSAGLNDDGTRGLASFIRGTPKPLPTFRAQFSAGAEILSNEGRDANPIPGCTPAGIGTLFGVVVASWCLHASLVADSDTTEYRRHGAERFAMAAHELMEPADGSAPHLYQGRVTLRQRSGGGAEYNVNWERKDHMYLLVTLVSKLEKNLTISPRSKPLDGQLRMLHFGKLPASDIMSIFGMAYEGGQHTELDVVGYEAIEGFRIDFEEKDPRWRRVCVDGKIVRVNEGGWMEVDKVADEFVELVTDA